MPQSSVKLIAGVGLAVAWCAQAPKRQAPKKEIRGGRSELGGHRREMLSVN